jgi:hypothetical protein
VPCYRYAGLLEGCVGSVLGQEGVDVRVLVIDDCSPDDTPEVAARLCARDERVQSGRHGVNVGMIPTLNEGLEWAEDSDYTVVLSADDLLVPDCLRRAVAVMGAHPEVGMVYGRSLYAYEGRPLPTTYGRWRGTDVWSGYDWVRARCRSGYNCISSPEVVTRTTVQRAVGGYDPACYHTSDLQLWLRVAAVADVAYIRGVGQAIYRIQPDGMLRSADTPIVDLSERRLAFDSFFAGGGAQLRDAQRLHEMACRSLARQALWQASRAIDRGRASGPDALPVEELTAFALDVYPRSRRLAEWRGLRLRRAIGEGRSRWFLPFVATGSAHRAKTHALKLRWKLKGI